LISQEKIMNKLIVKTVVALMFVALSSSSAMAQLDFRQYFGRQLPATDSNVYAVISTAPSYGLSWALAQRGKRIGRGECTDLVVQHLAISGGRPGDFRSYRNYIWGAKPNGARAGDIIQFELCKFRYTTPNSWYEIVMDHHTAIVVSYNETTKVMQVLHQNAPFGGPVKLDTIDLSKKTQGTYTIWRPVQF
jgi:hypothetical protein